MAGEKFSVITVNDAYSSGYVVFSNDDFHFNTDKVAVCFFNDWDGIFRIRQDVSVDKIISLLPITQSVRRFVFDVTKYEGPK